MEILFRLPARVVLEGWYLGRSKGEWFPCLVYVILGKFVSMLQISDFRFGVGVGLRDCVGC